MQQVLRIIDELTATLNSLLPMREEYRFNLDSKIRLEFNFNSNHIEGNTLTYGETELLLRFGKTTGQHELREYEEMQAHDVAFKMVQEWAEDKERPLTEMAIKNLNETLLVKPYWKEAETPDGQPTRRLIKVGDYKEYPNHVRLQNGEMFAYASPAETPIQMGELIAWYRAEQETKELHPLVLAAMLHYRFVRIHPFDDGNGRISRLLMNYVLLQYNLPPVVIKSADKKNYLFALNQADTGNIEAFITYIAEQLIWSLELYIKAAKGESLDEPGDLNKKLFLLKKKLGEDANAKVELKYGEVAISNVIQNTLIPFAEEWDKQLKEFEPLFNSNYVILSAGKNGFKDIRAQDLVKGNKAAIISGVLKVTEQQTIKLSAYFFGLKYNNNQTGIPTGELTITFYENNFQITFTGSNKKIHKLYDQLLTEEEIKTIIESLGNWFYNNVEQNLR